MFIDRSKLEEYPFECTFYRHVNEDNLPLDEQTGREEMVWESQCDITESSHSVSNNFISAKFVAYCPFDPADEEVEIRNGDRFSANFYGLSVDGVVVGVFPSQLGGITVYIQDMEA